MQQVTKCWQGHLCKMETRISETEQLGFLAMAMSYELGGSRWKELVGPSWSLGF